MNSIFTKVFSGNISIGFCFLTKLGILYIDS